MAYGSRWQSSWRPYVPVGQRRAAALLEMSRLRSKGVDIQPLRVTKSGGRKIARTFWGQAWCEHLEKFSDFANRLPRGRTYVRNGSVCHLEVQPGAIHAKVSGSDVYDVTIKIKSLPKDRWRVVTESCAGRIGSLLELLQGRLSDHVMGVVTDKDKGLFPGPAEIDMDCSCPDWADMCKHVAAVMYGVGVRLDEKPELLFALRGVDHTRLVSEESARAMVAGAARKGAGGAGRKDGRLSQGDIAEVFGIDVVAGDGGVGGATRRPVASGRRSIAKKSAAAAESAARSTPAAKARPSKSKGATTSRIGRTSKVGGGSKPTEDGRRKRSIGKPT